jgi:hypothetical protein
MCLAVELFIADLLCAAFLQAELWVALCISALQVETGDHCRHGASAIILRHLPPAF